MYHAVQQLKPACTTDIFRGEVEVARKDPGASQLTDDTGDSLQEVNVPSRQAFAKVQLNADKMDAAAAHSTEPSHPPLPTIIVAIAASMSVKPRRTARPRGRRTGLTG